MTGLVQIGNDMDQLQAAFPQQAHCDRQLALTDRMQVFQEKVGIDRAEWAEI